VQVKQVILNLAINARDALPKGGRLDIETQNIFLDEDDAKKHVEIKPGHYALMKVADTGMGMDASILPRIFEPFFTTKGQSKGTGLGLSTVYGIVKQSGGHIQVTSEPGQGSTFFVYLPLIHLASQQENWEEKAPACTKGRETILLIEDELSVLNLTKELLEEYEYRVIAHGKPKEAVEVFRERKDEIDLVITDVVMPEMSGQEVASQIHAIRDSVKILFMSGYTDDTIVRHGILLEGVNFIQKPFNPEALTGKVREVLDAGPAEPRDE
ncbi:response regulator, partial [bacterium]|nr:response regulator [bacterium]